MLMNRIDPDLFAGAFTSWVRETWADRPDSSCHRWQDLERQSRPQHRQGAAASGLGLRHDLAARAWPGSRQRQEQRDDREGVPAPTTCSPSRPDAQAKIERYFDEASADFLDSFVDLDAHFADCEQPFHAMVSAHFI